MNFGNPTEEKEAFQIVDRAMDAGINLLDCAGTYAGGRSEEILGRALKRDGKRGKALVTSKVYFPTGPGHNERGNGRHHVIKACHASLKRLQTDYIDIYFLHRTDWDVPQEETLATLDSLVNQGLVRHVACSTHPAWRIVEALHVADRHGYPKFTCEQPPYNLLDRRIENEILPMCREYDLGITAWSPLAQGVLSGRYDDHANLPPGSRGTRKPLYAERITQKGIEVAEKLSKVAKEKGSSTARLSVAWLLHQPGITSAILGPRTLGQLEDLLPASDLALDKRELESFDELVPPGGAVSNHFNSSGWMKS
jgi:aryl-alcohol dehydrogenase-like predicted oxidoreductase